MPPEMNAAAELPPADLILSELGEAVVVVNTAGRILYWNRAAVEAFGYDESEAVGAELVELLQVERDPGHVDELFDRLSAGSPVLNDYWVRCRDGQRRPYLATITPICRRHKMSALAIVAVDVTEWKAVEERYRLGFEHGAVPSALIGLDGRITHTNPAYCEFVRRSPDEIVGELAWAHVHADDSDRSLRERLVSGELERATVERRFLRPDGTSAWGLVSLGAVRDDEDRLRYTYCQIQDITDRKVAEQALGHLALHDPLTGLANRALVQDRLHGALVRARRYGRRVAVLLGDLDRFQLVNDTLGHRAGDQLLVEVSRRLVQSVRSADTIGRFGGDEFAVIFEDLAEATTPGELGGRVAAVFDEPFVIGGQAVHATISCGVVMADGDQTAEACIRDADSAVLLAKQRGGNRIETFHLQLRHQASRIFDLENALQLADVRGELRLAYQPLVEIGSGRVVGAEALMRWRTATERDVLPSEFIAVAEESDLILRLGAFAVNTAMADLARWRRRHMAGSDDFFVAVNISARQLGLGLVKLCEQALEAHGLEGSSLGLEVTERGVMADVSESALVLEELACLGIRIAVDDFGTGYSSLEYLRRLPVHALKIDRTFVAGLGTDDADRAIVQAIVDLARALGIDSCAEGVENTVQRAELERLGCPYAQGYLWHRPMQRGTFERWMATHHGGSG
jgi:diguanylate cyclase (GGDEF)-like protein/PAS domain S-box-containing protein